MKLGLKPQNKAYLNLLRSLDRTLEEANAYNAYLVEGVPFEELGLPKPVLLDPKDYETSYGKEVHPESFEKDGIYLGYRHYEPYQGFVYDEIEVDPKTFYEKTPFGYFKEPFPYLSLEENGVNWMSITPHEINTMREPLRKMRGKILVLGLGLGYFAYETLKKEEVTSLMVVDNDPSILCLFQERIAPFFPKKKPFSLLEGDAYQALEKASEFDSVFIDLWHMPDDGLPLYLKALPYEEKAANTHFEYWIEKSMLALIRRAVIILLEEEMNGYGKDENHKEAETFSDKLVNAIYFLLKDTKIEYERDLQELLEYPSLKGLARKLRL